MSDSGKAAGHGSRGRLRKTPPGTEIEIKLLVADRKAVLHLLKKLKARCGGQMHEMNTLYDTSAGALAQEGKLIRIRVLTPAGSGRVGKRAAVLTYKGPAQDDGHVNDALRDRYKVREEHEIQVADGEGLARILERMGLRPRFRYEKYRTTYRLPRIGGLVVDLDETPIGNFLELEGDAAAIERGAAILGYTAADYITKSYGQLFLEQCQMAEDCGDMLFSRRK